MVNVKKRYHYRKFPPLWATCCHSIVHRSRKFTSSTAFFPTHGWIVYGVLWGKYWLRSRFRPSSVMANNIQYPPTTTLLSLG